MGKKKLNEDYNIHKAYKKMRLIILTVFLFVLSFMTVGYASLNSILMMSGYLTLNGETGNLEIISVDQNGDLINGTSNGTNFYISESSTDDNVALIAEFDMKFYRTMGSANSAITYDVVIQNNSLTKRKLTTVNSSPTFTSGNSTLKYDMKGITFLTTIINPGDKVTVELTFSLSDFERYTNYSVYEVFEFNFSRATDEDVVLNISLDTQSVEFATFDDIIELSATVQNISSQNITYRFEVDNNNFEIVDSSGNELSDFTVSSYTTAEAKFYLKVTDNHIFADLTDNVGVTLLTTSPSILSYDLGNVTVTVPEDNVQKIISGKTILDDDTIDFTQVSTGSGLYKNVDSGDVTYFYRGDVNNNYVSFAGYTWRIIRIDKYGVRVILDDVIDTQSAWGNNPGVNASVDSAISQILYYNSPVKTIVDNWYTENLSSYSDIIKTSMFCLDTSYQTMISSGNAGVTVYYFGSYIRNGIDSTAYTPEFVCDSQYIKEYSIGLISGDEVAFAGGVFNTSNTNYYLYNSSISENWWTLSPSYYDSSLGTVGMLLVTGSSGRFNDWVSTSTIEYASYIRPVITLDTDRISGGSGIQSDMYTFS